MSNLKENENGMAWVRSYLTARFGEVLVLAIAIERGRIACESAANQINRLTGIMNEGLILDRRAGRWILKMRCKSYDEAKRNKGEQWTNLSTDRSHRP